MAKRKIISINQKRCSGCGECIPNCPEGAIQLIDGKARLISDIFCDGLGACLGHCPQGAISVREREAESYDEQKVMKNIVKQGKNTIIAHLLHLKEHGETNYLNDALEYLKEHDIKIEFETKTNIKPYQTKGCPSSQSISFKQNDAAQQIPVESQPSQLRQWPIQMYLISPDASYFTQSDVLLVADCVAYSIGDFHQRFLSGKRLAIACPKLDSNKEVYLQKLIKLIDEAHINTLTVITMDVPCCTGLVAMAKKAAEEATRNIPIKRIMISIKGEILRDEWI